jgi:hypothetical protein
VITVGLHCWMKPQPWPQVKDIIIWIVALSKQQ